MAYRVKSKAISGAGRQRARPQSKLNWMNGLSSASRSRLVGGGQWCLSQKGGVKCQVARQRELRGAGEDRKCSARRGKATRSTRAVAGEVRQWCQCWDMLTHPCALGCHHSVPVCLSSPNTSCFHIFTHMASCLNVLFFLLAWQTPHSARSNPSPMWCFPYLSPLLKQSLLGHALLLPLLPASQPPNVH